MSLERFNKKQNPWILPMKEIPVRVQRLTDWPSYLCINPWKGVNSYLGVTRALRLIWQRSIIRGVFPPKRGIRGSLGKKGAKGS